MAVPKHVLRAMAVNPFCTEQRDIRVETDFRSQKEQGGLGYVMGASLIGQRYSQARLVGTNLVELNYGIRDLQPAVMRFEPLSTGTFF